MSSRFFTRQQVAEQSRSSLDDNTEKPLLVIIDGDVFDVTKFQKIHPGGQNVLKQVAGQDATEQFWQMHAKNVMDKYRQRLMIGTLKEKDAMEKSNSKEQKEKSIEEVFGEGIPYGDPAWYQGWKSPYYNESHRRFRAAVRRNAEENILPHVGEWDEAKRVPREVYTLSGKNGILPLALGPPWPKEYAGDKIAGGVISVEEYDAFHELITIDESSRSASGGFQWAVSGGLAIGAPPIYKFGSKELKDRVMPGILKGEKIICLAITEPSGGSDVANLTTTAKKITENGKEYYVVNGEKKWITNGTYADWFTTAVRTGGPGQKGISFLLIERGPGVITRQMHCQGVWPSGTAYVIFENVKVPAENLIGRENKGFSYIVLNFNHERWSIAAQATRFSRVCYEESFRYACKRRTFGKRLIDHPVIRLKLANMARMIESTHAWLELITYQRTKLSKFEQDILLAGPVALLKAQSTLTMEFCAREASQIFGGLAYTRGGQGEKVERLYREVRAFSIPGGSEEIMLDLGVRFSEKISNLVKAFIDSGQSLSDVIPQGKL